MPTRAGLTTALIAHESECSDLGVTRRYLLAPGVLPTHDPDQLAVLHNDTREDHEDCPKPPISYGPFTSRTAFLLAEWYWNSTNKSFIDFQKLVSILNAEDFSVSDAVSVNWRAAFAALGANRGDLSERDGSWITDDGWMTATVSIDIPFHKKMNEPGTKTFTVGEFRYRSIVSAIKEKLSSYTDMRQFHYWPYQATWNRTSDSPNVELYGELYTSRAFREEHERIQRQAPTYHNEGLERVVVALMFWSDGTQLTSFGGASLWPGYLFFGNESKLRRGKPSEGLGQQIAYFMKLPDRLNDFLKDRNDGKLPTDPLFSYCARELFHKQWSILLNTELVEAMKHGIIMPCPDGKRRCFFPRIFSYSADYPEKVLVAGIRNNGVCPCHRCLVKQVQLSKLGAPSDTERLEKERRPADQQAKVSEAQDLIQRGYAVNNKGVIEKKLLQPTSLVPSKASGTTAFARNLAELDFNILSVLVVDILHEFEIGVWKRLYRGIPAFGRDTIRKFPLNVSEMKRRAARDYEDILQCAIPAFELLLPGDHNSRLMSLLYVCAQWHALAKLRLHSDLTLSLLDYTTTQLGAQMRKFYKETCLKVPTKERKTEAEARARQEAKDGKEASAACRPITLSVFTIKFHFLGDYTSVIRRLGTTDSYSTQTGELYHREPKSWYSRTDRKDYELQLSRVERRKARLSRIRAEIEETDRALTAVSGGLHPLNLSEANSISNPPLQARYELGLNANRSIDLDFFVKYHAEPHRRDLYLVDFINVLKKHLFRRLIDRLGDAASLIPADQWVHIVLRANKIHSHQLLRINYTSYDVRRDQDILHIDTPQCNIMVLNDQYTPETWLSEHPYIYGKLLGVFHAEVSYAGPLPRGTQRPGYHRIDLAWVHWYDFLGSTSEFSLDRISLRPMPSGAAVDFIDPSDIVRSVHLLPQFSLGKADGPVLESRFVGNQPAWKVYFVNKFVDRDMFMRYQLGMSVGHAYMHTKSFPPPQIPIVPHDFDHCTNIHPTPTPTVSPTTQINEAGQRNASPIGRGEEGARDSVEEGGSCTTGNPALDDDGVQELGDDGVSDHGDEEIQADYLDDLNDYEVIAYADMYGDDKFTL